MKVVMNIKKSYFFTILSVLLVSLSVFVVYAYNANPGTVTADPSVFGHTSDEITVIKEDGTSASLSEYIQDQISTILAGGPVSCPTAPALNTTGQASTALRPVAMDVDACKISESGCIIRQSIWDETKKKFIVTRQYEYKQDASNDLWWSTFQTSGKYTNGGAFSSNSASLSYPKDIIPNYKETISGTPTVVLYLRDDGNPASSGETSNSQWTALDKSARYSHVIYVCTYLSDA